MMRPGHPVRHPCVPLRARQLLRRVATVVLLVSSPRAAHANRVTYQVDMSVQQAFQNFDPARGDKLMVSGTFSTPNWTTDSELTPSASDTNVYQGTFTNDVAAGAWGKHKFIIDQGGRGTALVWEFGNDRSFRVSASDQTLPVVYFNNETNTQLSAQVTFRVNLAGQREADQFDPRVDRVSVSADIINNGGTTLLPLTNSTVQPHFWRGTCNVTTHAGTPINFRFAVHPQGGSAVWESDDVGEGGTPYRQAVLTRSNMVLPVSDFNNLAPTQEFIAGADMSHLVFFKDRGIDYRVDGQVQDALTILRDRGINCVRLRVFTSSEAQALADPYNYTNNLSYTLPLALRVKDAGMKFMLDFHYSDTWADPGHQSKPSDWTGLDTPQLVAQIRAYTSNTVAALRAAGAPPDYVQIGNEITPGLLWNDGRVGGAFDTPAQWSQLTQLLKSAASGVRDAAGEQMPKLMIHIAAGGDWGATRWYFDNLEAHDVPFDIIAQSYYPWWHGSLDDLRDCTTRTAERYGRPIMVVETAFPWTGDAEDSGFPATPEGQVEFTVALAQIVKGVPGGKGMGIVWWGTEYQAVPGHSLAAFDRRSFFNADGDVLPVASAWGQMTEPVTLSIALRDNAVMLQWPLSGAGMYLSTTPDLSAASSWSPLSQPVQYADALLNATIPLNTTSPHCYRLEAP